MGWVLRGCRVPCQHFALVRGGEKAGAGLCLACFRVLSVTPTLIPRTRVGCGLHVARSGRPRPVQFGALAGEGEALGNVIPLTPLLLELLASHVHHRSPPIDDTFTTSTSCTSISQQGGCAHKRYIIFGH